MYNFQENSVMKYEFIEVETDYTKKSSHIV